MDITTKFLAPVAGFLAAVAFGFWLSKVGRPYNGILFNIHKLIALGTVIFLSANVYKALKVLEPESLLIVSLALAAIGAVALFASGAFLSIGNLEYQTMKTVHIIALVMEGMAFSAIVYWFAGRA